MRGHTWGTRRVAVGLAVTLAGLFGAMGTAHAESEGSIFLSTSVSPSVVTAGSETLWTVTIANESESALPVTVDLSSSAGAFDLATMKTLNGNICTPGTSSAQVECNVPAISGGSTVDLDAVVNTTGIDAPATVFLNASASASDESADQVEDHFDVAAATGTSTQGYVPPGGSENLGGKKPTAETPAVVTVKLPKKTGTGSGAAGVIGAATTATALPPGPGAVITLTSTPCDSSCKGNYITINDFPGYNDPAHPVLATVSWFGPTLFGPTTLEIVTHNTVITPAKCVKVKGVYTNHPCIVKESLNKKTGTVTDVIAFLSGDPIVRRK